MLGTGCWIFTHAPRVRFKNIQHPETSIHDPSIINLEHPNPEPVNDYRKQIMLILQTQAIIF